MTLVSAVRVLLIFGVALGIYWGVARVYNHTETPDVAYFNHLAEAFLQGRTYIPFPPSEHDLTPYQGRWYVPFPPLPALLLLPWVWWAGVNGVNTVLFCALFGALNVTLVNLLLGALGRHGWSQLNTADNLWLTLLFGLGSVHWYMSTIGSVWFVAQVCAVTFVALAVWLAVERRSPWLVGGALALAVIGRPNLIFTWPLLVGIGARQLWPSEFDARRPIYFWPLLRTLAFTTLPILFAVGALLMYNWVRFADPFDFGYLRENVAEELAPDLHTYGQFNLRYLAKNIWAMWLAGPRWNAETRFFEPDGAGMSLLLTTPAILYLARARRRDPLTGGAWLAFGLLLAPLLLYYNTGWWQFGYRFSLDFMIPVMVLLALGAGRRVSGAMRCLIVVGVIVNAWGVHWWHG